MKLDPFIEAEKTAGHSVTKSLWSARGLPFRLLPTPKRQPLGPPGRRRRAHRADHRRPSMRVQGHLWLPEGPRGHSRQHGIDVGRRRVTRLMRVGRHRRPVQESLAKDDHLRPRGRGRPGPHPARLRTGCRARPPLRRRHHLHRHLGGVGVLGHRHRPGLPHGGGLGIGRPHAHRAGRRRPEMAFGTGRPRRSHLPLGPRLSIHECGLRPPRPRPTASCCRSACKGECWDNAVAESFFATIKRELIDTGLGRRERDSAASLQLHRRLYNIRRQHSSLGYHSPADFEAPSTPRRPSGRMIN